jgi:hypothetical protein
VCRRGITIHTYLSKKDCGGPIRFMNFQQWILEISQFLKKIQKIQNISTIKNLIKLISNPFGCYGCGNT